MNLNIWGDILKGAFEQVLAGVLGVLPNIVIAIVVVILGWLIGIALLKIVEQIVRAIKLDKALSSAGLDELLGKG